jgi:glycosidase
MRFRYRHALFLSALLALAACGPAPAVSTDQAPAGEPPIPLAETVLYELYVRSFSPEGTFAGVVPRLGELEALGVTTIWLMPIHPVGEERRKGELGSPYSIADYRAVNPEFGTMEDFRRLLAAVQDRGMYLILDLVANHTAWDHPWVQAHPEWYLRDENGDITHPPGTDWTDVAALDYDNPEVRAAMLAEMRFWVAEVGIDGFRADVAELVPNDFWEEAIRELRAIRPLFMLAEGHVPELHASGFDVTYAWSSYHALKSIWNGARADTVVAIVEDELARYPLNGRLRFTTNHDETAWDDTPLALFGGRLGAQAAAVVAATLPGVPLIYNGQEVGDTQRLPLFEQVPIQWDRDPEMRAFYEDLFARRAASRALREGAFNRVAHDAGADVVAFRRSAEGEEVTVIVNVRERPVTVTLEGRDSMELDAYGWRITEQERRAAGSM